MSSNTRRAALVEALLAALLVGAFAGFYAAKQEPIRRRGGLGWDGVAYHEAARAVTRGQPPTTHSPYESRPGIPWVVARLFPDRLYEGFRLVNAVLAVVACGLFFLWLRRWLEDPRVRLLCLALFALSLRSVLRYVWFYPVSIGQGSLVAFLGLLLVSIHPAPRRWPLLWLGAETALTAAFVPVRGAIVALVPLSASLSRRPLTLESPWLCRLGTLARGLLPHLPALAAAGLAWWAVGEWTQHVGAEHRYAFEAKRWLYAKSPPMIFLAWCITYGPALALLLFDARFVGRYLGKNQGMLVYLVGVFGLSLIGGSDTERMLFWASPVVFVLIGKVIERNLDVLRSLPLSLSLLAAQALSQRWLWTYPQTGKKRQYVLPYLAPYGDEVDFLDLWSYHGRDTVSRMSTVEYAVVIFLFFVWLRWRRRKLDAKGAS